MKKQIFKYTLNYYSVPEIVRMPMGAKIIDFGQKDQAFHIWAIVNPKRKVEKRVFILAMTGQDLPWNIKQALGTYVIQETGMVVHLLELAEVKEGSGGVLANDPTKDNRIV